MSWPRLRVQSAATLPDALAIVEDFRERTLQQILGKITTNRTPRPALRIALRGWLGFIDAAILDWIDNGDLQPEKLRDLLLSAFGAALLAAQQADPTIKLR